MKPYMFQPDDLDWVVGEFMHAVTESYQLQMLACEYDPELARSVVAYFEACAALENLSRESANLTPPRFAGGAP